VLPLLILATPEASQLSIATLVIVAGRVDRIAAEAQEFQAEVTQSVKNAVELGLIVNYPDKNRLVAA
jgi:hypothetical protein